VKKEKIGGFIRGNGTIFWREWSPFFGIVEIVEIVEIVDIVWISGVSAFFVFCFLSK
jgi:hypothetical protein